MNKKNNILESLMVASAVTIIVWFIMVICNGEMKVILSICAESLKLQLEAFKHYWFPSVVFIIGFICAYVRYYGGES